MSVLVIDYQVFIEIFFKKFSHKLVNLCKFVICLLQILPVALSDVLP